MPIKNNCLHTPLCLREAALYCQDSGVDSAAKTTWLLTMRFRQQPCTTRRIIAVDLRIGYSLCPMRPARGYTSSSFAQERSVNRLEAVSQPVRGRGLEMSVIGTYPFKSRI